MTTNGDVTRSLARYSLVISIVAIAIGYASAFVPGGAPQWAPWLLALGIPASLCSIMILGAARGKKGIGALKAPFLFVFVILAAGFCLSLALPDSEAAGSQLFLGLPLRAAILIYGVGLVPIVVLPVAYALTFETQTLNESDIQKVRAIAADIRNDKR